MLRGTVEEMVYGTLVRDPYRWLEDRNLPETGDWIRSQQRRCEQYFGSCPELALIEGRVREYLDVEVVDQPARIADRYFYRKRSNGQQQGSIRVREVSSGEERALVDPSPDGLYTSVGIYRISADGAFLAYEVRRGGEDRKEIRVAEVHTGAVLPHRIPPGYGRGFAFSRDGYFYCHETDISFSEHEIRYQTFGSADRSRVVFRAPRTRGSRLALTGNAHWLGAIWLHPEGPEMLIDFWIADVVDESPEWIEVFRNKLTPYSPILCHARILVLAETEPNASELIELSSKGEKIDVFVPGKDTPIGQIAITQDRIFVGYLERGIPAIESWLLSGRPAEPIHLPPNGTIQLLPVQSQDAGSFFYTYESFDIPPAIYEYDARTNTSILWHQRGPEELKRCSHVRETTVRSKDGTQIPLTLVTAEPDGPSSCPRPIIMTSYGGFGLSTTPQFSVLAAVMLGLGAVLALPTSAEAASSARPGTTPDARTTARPRSMISSPLRSGCATRRLRSRNSWRFSAAQIRVFWSARQ